MIGYTVIGGFLGVGKTTLINAMLATAEERLAVIVNDIGEINIDAALIATGADPQKTDTIELTNGCVCCSVGDSLASTLRDLCLGHNPPDRIVLECSGAADPGRAAAYGSRRVLEEPSIVVVVDATDVRHRAEDPRFTSLIDAQLSAAHQLVLTKTDLLPATSNELASNQISSVTDWLAERTAATVSVGHPGDVGSVLTAALLYADSHVSSNVATQQTASQTAMGQASKPHSLTVTTEHFDAAMQPSDIEAQLADISGLLRAKGIVETAAGPMLFQWAAGRCSSEPWTGPMAKTGIVTIS